MERVKRIGRYAFCILLVAAFFLVYELRLFQWQVLEGEEFERLARYDRTDVIETDAVRGRILDRNGEVLAGSRTAYQVIYNALYMNDRERNSTILQVVDLLTERGEAWRDILPIRLNPEPAEEETGDETERPLYIFEENREADVTALKESLHLAEYATADQCVAQLAENYRCTGFSTEDARTVTSVRYSMTKDGFSWTNPYVIAEDVSIETVGVVEQRAGNWPGIETRVSVARDYGENGDLAPNIVGVVGRINQEEYEAAVENGAAYDYAAGENISGYKLNDSLGKFGLEAVFEQQLRGSRGEETIYTDETGEVESTAVTTAPKAGGTVWTTLDANLQRVANQSLRRNIEGNTDAKNCISGAAVVLDVKDFGVLACASYPTYDIADYFTDYTRLEGDVRLPLMNKALQGRYTPGSVFKPLVALAALQEGVVGVGTTYYCDPEFGFKYGEEGEGQLIQDCTCGGGNRDVYSGLAYSCNTYFSNVGLDLGIRRLDAYAEYFGLGQTTGVELEEYTGTMTGPQEYQRNHGVSMPGGVTAQTAIGQADNMFTPMQLAAYCATIANGGKRLSAHFLSKITDYGGEEVLESFQPEEILDAQLSQEVLNVVREGMISVAEYGTARTVFGDYPVAVACKTGTAETSIDDSTEPNISFICYAPAYDPQIAVAVMLEHGNKGDWAKYVAKDLLDQYFGYYTWDRDGNRYDSYGNMVNLDGEIIRSAEEIAAERALEEERERQEFLSGEENGLPQTEPTPEATETPAAPAGGDAIPAAPYVDPSAAPAPAESPEASLPPDSPYYRPDG